MKSDGSRWIGPAAMLVGGGVGILVGQNTADYFGHPTWIWMAVLGIVLAWVGRTIGSRIAGTD